VNELASSIVAAVTFRQPFVLFGHSLGGLVAFETARRLQALGMPQPRRLFLSSSPPPGSLSADRSLHTLPNAELLDTIERRWGTLPRSTRENADLLTLTLRALRADLEMFETYVYQPGPPLRCPVTVLAGNEEVPEVHMDRWRKYTYGEFMLQAFPGGHFYVREHREEIAKLINDTTDWRDR
jgi:surfactin synthase thioesterase subunit